MSLLGWMFNNKKKSSLDSLVTQNLSLFTKNIDQVENNFSMDSFIFFLDQKEKSNITAGRLFYNIDGIDKTSKENKIIKFNQNPTVKTIPQEVQILDYCTKVFESLKKNKKYQNQLNSFSQKYGTEKRDELELFIAAQAAYRLYEEVQRKQYYAIKNVKSYKKLDNKINKIRLKIKNLEQNPKSNKKILEKLNEDKEKYKDQQYKLENSYATEGKKLNRTLESARQKIISFYNPPKVSKREQIKSM